LGKAVARGAARAAGKTTTKSVFKGLLGRDSQIHARTAAKRLTQPKTVFRYTSSEEARVAATRGIQANRHMTSSAGPGRPLSAAAAQARYGLERPPAARLTVRLPKGQPVQRHKAVGGGRGVGAIVSPAPVPVDSLRRIVPLR